MATTTAAMGIGVVTVTTVDIITDTGVDTMADTATGLDIMVDTATGATITAGTGIGVDTTTADTSASASTGTTFRFTLDTDRQTFQRENGLTQTPTFSTGERLNTDTHLPNHADVDLFVHSVHLVHGTPRDREPKPVGVCDWVSVTVCDCLGRP